MNWQNLKSLYELYETGRTKSRETLITNATFRYLADQTKELFFARKYIVVDDSVSFKKTFEGRYLNKYLGCLKLLNDIGENIPQCRFEVDDIIRLIEMKLQMDNNELDDVRQQIIDSNETRRGVSLMFFKHEKHLDFSPALERAVKTILKIDVFADMRDFQYLYVLQCDSPRLIILCENLYFLKMPEKPRKNNIELWYAGGRNIEKLKYTQNRDLPIYYLCDWDHDGLDIYKSVKKLIPDIQLLTPNGQKRDINSTEHKSLWRNRETPSLLSDLPGELYSDSQKQLIMELVRENAWVVEESNDLIALLLDISYTRNIEAL